MVTTRRAVFITALVCLTPIVSHSIGRSVYGLLLEPIKSELGLNNAQAGWPSSGIFVLYVVGVLLVVMVSPRLEPVTIMRSSLLISVVGLFVTATAQGLVALTIGVALVGGAGAGIWMTAPVLATEYVPHHRRGAVIGALTSTIGLSNIAFGVGTSALRKSAGNDQLWRPVWWIAFGFTAALFSLLVAGARFDTTARVRAALFDLSVVTHVPRWKEVTIAYALFGGMTAGFGTFIVVALADHGNVASSRTPLIFALMGVSGMVASPVAGAISDRLDRLTVLRASLVVLTIANVLVAIGGPAPTIVGALLYAAGASTFPALIAAYVRDSLDSREFSQALAIMTVMFSVMAAIMAAAAGALGDISFRWSYLMLGALPALGLAVLVVADTHKP